MNDANEVHRLLDAGMVLIEFIPVVIAAAVVFAAIPGREVGMSARPFAFRDSREAGQKVVEIVGGHGSCSYRSRTS